MKGIFRGLLSIVVLTSLAACHAQEAAGDLELSPTVIESSTRYRKEYLLAAGDHLDILVLGHPEISRVSNRDQRGIIIRPDGFISMPLINDVKAAGLTVSELDASLTKAFSTRLVDPEVTVIWTSLREPLVYVLGEVANPRAVELRLATTAAQAVTFAGGMKHTGAKDAVALIRLTDEGFLRAYKIPVNVQGQPGPYMALQATVLQADDIIYVPETDIAQFDRWVNDYVNTPLSGVNSVLAPVANFLLISDYLRNN